MPAKTEAELNLERQYELLRKKKAQEQNAHKAKQCQESSTKSQQGKAAGDASKAPGVAQELALQKAREALLARQKAAAKPSSTGRKLPGGVVATPASRSAAGPSAAGEAPSPKPEPVDPMMAAKNAMAARQAEEAKKVSDVDRKRPALKRPTVQQVSTRLPQAPAEEPQQERPKRQRIEYIAPEPSRRPPRERQDTPPLDQPEGDATLFVNDLPPGTSSEDLSDFMVNFAPVVEARVVGGRGYAFVTFGSAADAEEVLAVTSHNPVLFHGYPLRLSHAHASNPDHQRAPPRAGPPPPRHWNPPPMQTDYEHPRVREAREAAAMLMEQNPYMHLPGMDLAMPDRPLVSYEDL